MITQMLWAGGAAAPVSVEGLYVYVMGSDGADGIVHQYSLGTAWDLTTASYDGSFDPGGTDAQIVGLAWSADGTKVYLSETGTGVFRQFAVTTPWDITTASGSAEETYDYSASLYEPNAIAFKPDGTELYAVGISQDTTPAGNWTVRQWSLATAWDISSAAFTDEAELVQSNGHGQGFAFKPDGTRLYAVIWNLMGSDGVEQYDMSVAWDITTITYDDLLDVGATTTVPFGFSISSDGLRILVGEQTDDASAAVNRARSYTLGTAWDVATAVDDGDTLDCSTEIPIATDVLFGAVVSSGGDQAPDLESGVYWYFLGYPPPGRRIWQYEFGAAWDIETAAYVSKVFDPTVDMPTPYWISVSPSGVTLIVGSWDFDASPETQRIWQYELATPGDVDTAFDTGKYFEPTQGYVGGNVVSNGLHMYTNGGDGEGAIYLHEYSIGVAWDMDTAAYVQTLDLTSEGNCNFSQFKPDGTEMYFIGGGAEPEDDVFVVQYTLSTPWNIGTATRTGQYVVSTEYPGGMQISSDGLTLIISISNVLRQFTFGTAWDVTTLAPTGSPEKQFDLTPVISGGIAGFCTP